MQNKYNKVLKQQACKRGKKFFLLLLQATLTVLLLMLLFSEFNNQFLKPSGYS